MRWVRYGLGLLLAELVMVFGRANHQLVHVAAWLMDVTIERCDVCNPRRGGFDTPAGA